jgi:hypothetical protein
VRRGLRGAGQETSCSAVILGASVLRIVAVGPLFTAGALPMLGFLWVGIRVAHGP